MARGTAPRLHTAPSLIVYKLVADQARDREDIAVVLRTQTRAGREFDWAYLERWAGFWGVLDRLDDLRTPHGDSRE